MPLLLFRHASGEGRGDDSGVRATNLPLRASLLRPSRCAHTLGRPARVGVWATLRGSSRRPIHGQALWRMDRSRARKLRASRRQRCVRICTWAEDAACRVSVVHTASGNPLRSSGWAPVCSAVTIAMRGVGNVVAILGSHGTKNQDVCA